MAAWNEAGGFARSVGDELEDLIDLIAGVTRYPREVLAPDADLENDLGIDSVKRGEILIAVRKRFELGDEVQFPVDAFRTIRSAAAALAGSGAPPRAAEALSAAPVQVVARSPAAATAGDQTGGLLAELTSLVAEVTRYPAEVLQPDADFENDLGIDSVKRGEILVAVRRRFGLPDDVRVEPESFRNLRSAATMIGSFVQVAALEPAVNEPIAPLSKGGPVSAPAALAEPLLPRLRRVVARVTRYPEEIIEPGADFENDLGIDSVKRGEILIAVRQELGLNADTVVSPEQFRTLESAARMLEGLVGAAAASAAPAEAPRPIPAPLAPVALANVELPGALASAAAPPRANYQRELTEIFTANDARPFAGKVALVTGSGRGIGKEIARSLAHLGATVIVNAFHSREEGELTTAEINRSGGTAHFVWGSVANPQQRADMFDRIEQLGGLDFFISNASNGLIGPFDQISDEHWAKGFQTNLVGLHQCALRAAPMMARRGGGKIITLSTPVSNRHVADFSCMAALKASVESLTRSMAVEFEKYNVTVNCISAGAVYGDLIKKFPDSDKAIRYWEEKSLGKRLVYTQEICNFINFLLSGATEAINGSVLVIDGGITIRL